MLCCLVPPALLVSHHAFMPHCLVPARSVSPVAEPCGPEPGQHQTTASLGPVRLPGPVTLPGLVTVPGWVVAAAWLGHAKSVSSTRPSHHWWEGWSILVNNKNNTLFITQRV